MMAAFKCFGNCCFLFAYDHVPCPDSGSLLRSLDENKSTKNVVLEKNDLPSGKLT